MRDHLARSSRSRPPHTVVGVRELKTHAARIVRQVRDARASFTVTHRGRAVGVILPIEATEETRQAFEAGDTQGAWQEFIDAGRRLEGRFRPGVSGVGLLSAMRR